MRNGTHSNDGFDEAIRYYRNARELLARCKVQDDIYEDIKPVREAFGTAWLAVDLAIKEALRKRGTPPKQIPRSWEPLLASAVRHLSVKNGHLVKLLNLAYHEIHLAGYYYGDFQRPQLAKEAMQTARRVVETLSSHGGCGTPPSGPTTMGGRTRRGAARRIG